MSKPYTVIRYKKTYVARFYGGLKRTFKAVNDYQADRIAEGLAKSNGWTIQTVGKA